VVKNPNQIREISRDKRFTVMNYMAAALFFLIILYPIAVVLASSFSSPSAVAEGKVWLWPVNPSLRGYKAVLDYKRIPTGFLNSFLLLSGGTALCLLVTVLGAYPLSRKDLAGRKAIAFFFTFTMFFGGGMIPFYNLIRNLQLIDSLWSLILPSAISVWNIIMMRTYVPTAIPGELLEAAKMDGCDDFRFLFRVVLPLSLPIVAVLGLFTAVGFWNSYFNALLFINTPEKFPLQLVLRDILVSNSADPTQIAVGLNDLKEQQALIQSLKYSVIVVSSLPLMLLFPFVQRFFVKGMILGSLKG
jgi:multiple sugar transport system permease protein/putative aldouronate transport system permease protein